MAKKKRKSYTWVLICMAWAFVMVIFDYELKFLMLFCTIAILFAIDRKK